MHKILHIHALRLGLCLGGYPRGGEGGRFPHALHPPNSNASQHTLPPTHTPTHSWNSSYGANSSAVEDTELRRSMDDVQRKLDQLKSTVNDVMGDNRSSGNDWSSGRCAAGG